MTLYTLGTVMSHATQMLGNRSDIAQSDASFWANEAAQQLWNALPHDSQEAIAISSTTSGEDKITFPSDFYELVTLSNTSIAPPLVLNKRNVYDIDSDTTTSGIPQEYVEFSTWLELHPIPDSAYSLQMRYKTRPSVLTATASVPSFDTRFGVAWLYKTASLLAESVLDFDLGTFYDSRYLSMMATIPSDRALRQRSREGANLWYQREPRGARKLDFDNRID